MNNFECVCTLCKNLENCMRCKIMCDALKSPIYSCSARIKLNPIECKCCGHVKDKERLCPICGM